MSFILTSGKKKKHAYSAWLFLVLVHKGEEVIYRGRNRGKKKMKAFVLNVPLLSNKKNRVSLRNKVLVLCRLHCSHISNQFSWNVRNMECLDVLTKPNTIYIYHGKTKQNKNSACYTTCKKWNATKGWGWGRGCHTEISPGFIPSAKAIRGAQKEAFPQIKYDFHLYVMLHWGTPHIVANGGNLILITRIRACTLTTWEIEIWY